MPFKDPEARKAYVKAYYAKNKESIQASGLEYRQRHGNREIARARAAAWYAANMGRAAAYRRTRRKSDPQYKAAGDLRARISTILRRADMARNSTGYSLVGITPTGLREYISSLWEDGMTWENYGITGWHIDHIVPLSVFDLSDPLERARSCYYTNLQPMWYKDNIRKGSRVAA